MKTFPLKLSDELHKEIRSKAFKAEKSMHAYILDCINRMNDAEVKLTDDIKDFYKDPLKDDSDECNSQSFCGKCDRCKEATHHGAEIMGITKHKKKPKVYGIPKGQSARSKKK